MVWLLRAPLLTAVGSVLVKEDGPSKADVIVVLGGDGYGTRILKGAELANAGWAPELWVSGPPELDSHESDRLIRYAESKGFGAVKFHPVFLTPAASSTRGEAILIGKKLREKGVRKILLVTSNFHTGRAKYLWNKEDPWLQVATVAASDPNFTPAGWWKTRDGQKTFFLESAKTVASHLGD